MGIYGSPCLSWKTNILQNSTAWFSFLYTHSQWQLGRNKNTIWMTQPAIATIIIFNKWPSSSVTFNNEHLLSCSQVCRLAGSGKVAWVLLDRPPSWRWDIGPPHMAPWDVFISWQWQETQGGKPNLKSILQAFAYITSPKSHWPKQVLQSNINGVDKS